jgi:DNA-binding XRE family transcriptional regulator
MNARTEVQIIHGRDGSPAFAVVPYADWLAIRDKERSLVPNEVVNLVFDREWTTMRAWREYLGLTQAEVASRAGVTQSAYAQMEIADRPRLATIKKIAMAMEITPEQLNF